MTSEANNFSEQSPFTIPELPTGKELKFLLLYPWDDPFYIGISALEIFSQCGKRVKVAEITTNAVEQSGSLESLLSHQTCPSTDAKRMWTCNYRKNEDLPIWIKITLEEEDTISLIRVWNYCQSRVHALRGVHQMKIELDEKVIFEGEITCAFSDGNEEKFLGDTILFTTDNDILNNVAENDIFLKEYEIATIADNLEISCDSDESSSLPSPVSSLTDSSIQRPRTAANVSRESGRITNGEMATIKNNNEASIENLEERNILKTKLFHIELCANWGHEHLIGLTEIQFLNKNEEPIPSEGVIVKLTNAELEENNNLSSLINGKILTCHPQEMCLIKYNPILNNTTAAVSPMISFSFPNEVEITGVSIWNYNASPELASAGVQCAQFYVNGKAIVGTVLLRRAPGYVYFDYVQDVTFDRCHLFRPLTSRPATRSISAFIFQFRLLSTWGDEFYIGLNGIELYNRRNHLIQLRNQNIAAFPESVNILPSVDNDPRSSDKLIDGENDTKRAQHMWLTPMLPNRYARVFIIFDSPTYVSKIKIYNYRKTPQRGVHHISLSADDLIIFSGEVPMSSASETGILEINLRDC